VIIFRYLVLVHGPAYLRKFSHITCEPLWVMGGRAPGGVQGQNHYSDLKIVKISKYRLHVTVSFEYLRVFGFVVLI